jgi:hypothetical protein
MPLYNSNDDFNSSNWTASKIVGVLLLKSGLQYIEPPRTTGK